MMSAVFGFDNIADALSLSPTLMEKYLAAAEKIARLAVFGPELNPLSVRIEPTRPRRMEINPIRIEQLSFYSMTDYDATGLSHPGSFHLTHRFPASGEYLFRVRADGAKPPGSEPQMLDLWIDGKIVQSFEVPNRVTATNERLPEFMEVRLNIAAGRHRLIAAFPRLFEGLPASFNGPKPSKLLPPPPGNVPPLDESAVGTSASLRAQMEQHRKNPVCASCHARMDPLGFALENYDAVGAWRTKDGKFPIQMRRGERSS